MKKIFLFAIISFLFIQCSGIKSNNRNIAALHSVEELKKDVDFAHRKLRRLHPNLYWYISKEALDYKFDSLKTTINKPMNSMDFFKKISPIIASVRQGHMIVVAPMKMLTKQETKILSSKGMGPFSQFEFELLNDKLYVTKNKSYDKSIQPGFEVVAINDTNPQDLMKSYYSWFASDGFNITFKTSKISKVFPGFYSSEFGIQDSIRYSFKFNDSVKTVSIKRKVVDSVKNTVKATPKKLTSVEKKANKIKHKAEIRKKSIYGYNDQYKNYNRNLSFKESDSSVAVMKIRGFSIGDPYTFYRESFKKIKDYNSSTLIIDLRDNPGGRLSEITNLYSYLTDSTYVFANQSEVVSKTSMFQADYFKTGTVASKIAKGILSPLYYGYTFFKVHKNDNGKYYYSTRDNKPLPANPNAFKGKIYVLINGGSFSASSIISSNLKGSKRAFFVGEETGGAFNGTVAGRMPLVELPNSKLKIRMGLMFISASHKTDIEGRGIFPDKEIVPTLEDRISGNDPEMNWILENIRSNKTQSAATTASN